MTGVLTGVAKGEGERGSLGPPGSHVLLGPYPSSMKQLGRHLSVCTQGTEMRAEAVFSGARG